MHETADFGSHPFPQYDHAHEADLDMCLDFINSEEYSDGVPEEHLPTVDDGIAYFVARGLAHEPELRAQAAHDGDAWLGRLRATRAALRDAWDAQVDGRAPVPSAVALLNEVLAHPTRQELRPTLAGLGVTHHHAPDDPTGEALARVIAPLVAEIASGETGRFRVCANDGCRWVFEDTSRGGRRRWCDMSSCGNRAKVQRFRSRRRESGAPAADGDPAAGGDPAGR